MSNSPFSLSAPFSASPSPPPSLDAAPPPPPIVLPDPLYVQNSNLYNNLIRGIQTKFGLTSHERLVLLGVLKHMPLGSSPDDSAAATTLVERILSLNPVQIQHLAEIFTSGLLDARSWGGSRKSVCSRAISRQSVGDSLTDTASTGTECLAIDTSYSDIFEHLRIAPFPRRNSPADDTGPTDQPRGLPRGTAAHSRACLKRQNSRCPLTTQSDIGLETAHLIPHSVAALKKSETPFWLLLAICLGPQLRDYLYSIICGADSYSTTNGLALDCKMHKFFGKGVFYLVPLPELAFDTRTSRHLDVCFKWKYSPDNLGLCFTRLPRQPEEQTRITTTGSTTQSLAPHARQINDGDIFRLVTDDPARLPLPHPFLLSLHSVLWEMIGSSGLGESGQEKRKCLQRPTAQGDSDDSSDDAHPNARKRVKRKTRKHGKNKDGHQPSRQQQQQLPSGNADPGGPSNRNKLFDPDTVPPPYGDTHTADNSAPTSARPTTETKRQAGDMTFLDREYLAFKLRQLQEGHLDFALDDSSNYDSDSSTSSITSGADVVASRGTWPSASRTPANGGDGMTFLQKEYLAFKQHQREAGDVLESSTDGSVSDEEYSLGYSSDEGFDSDIGSSYEAGSIDCSVSGKVVLEAEKITRDFPLDR